VVGLVKKEKSSQTRRKGGKDWELARAKGRMTSRSERRGSRRIS
jgi:hypothetical protein